MPMAEIAAGSLALVTTEPASPLPLQPIMIPMKSAILTLLVAQQGQTELEDAKFWQHAQRILLPEAADSMLQGEYVNFVMGFALINPAPQLRKRLITTLTRNATRT